jgi:hypothetical protein
MKQNHAVTFSEKKKNNESFTLSVVGISGVGPCVTAFKV